VILSESEIISRIARLKSSAKNLIAGDDVGAFRLQGIAYCGSDSVIENTHYRSSWVTPGDIAVKLFARNWSDFIVKGIKPRYAMLNLGLSQKNAEPGFLNPFLAGLDRLFSRHAMTLIGGDTARSATDVFTLTFFGDRGKFIPRKGRGVKPGDLIVQLGPIGGADLARRLMRQKAGCPRAIKKFFTHPQILPALPGRNFLKAAIDQSDSVAKTFAILAQMNSAELTIAVEKIRVSHPRIVKAAEILNAAEDLAVFAIADKTLIKTTRAFQPVGHIESIRVKHPGVVYRLRGKTVSHTADGYEHFK
jgi:thiamine-monophosphate kinase